MKSDTHTPTPTWSRPAIDNDGGPAFPVTIAHTNVGPVTTVETFFGMSLRDWFAGQALAGSLAACANPASCGPEHAFGSTEQLGLTCYQIADAMLAARKSGGT